MAWQKWESHYSSNLPVVDGPVYRLDADRLDYPGRCLLYIYQPEVHDEILLSHFLCPASLIVRSWSVDAIDGAAGRRVFEWKAPSEGVSVETGRHRPLSCRVV